MSNTAWTIDEAEIARIVGDWYKFNPYEPQETFTRDEVKCLMYISRKDMQRRLDEIINIVEEGKKLFMEYDEQKTKQIADLEAELLKYKQTTDAKV